MGDNPCEFADTVNFTASEFALGRQRCRKWVPLVTQQLRLRHVYQIYVYNIPEDKRATFFFTLHSTPMSAPFYTSEKVAGKNPKWNELRFGHTAQTHVSSVVIRIWRSMKDSDEILLTWGVNFTGLMYLGNKISDLQPTNFRANTVIFFMQGVYFTSQAYLRTDLNRPLPFEKNLNLIETLIGKQVLYRKVSVNSPKGEVAVSYTLEKLRRLQELQRLIKNRKVDVQHLKEQIKSATEREPKQDQPNAHNTNYSNNIRFAPQLLTMNSLNKMLHEKPTKAEREAMTRASKRIEVSKFRLRLLHQERDAKCANLRRLKQCEVRLGEENEEKNSNLMSLYHILSKESQQWNDYVHTLGRRKELLTVVHEQIRHRQQELLRELLFIYPIEKLPNENKYIMLGIHLPDSELLLDYQDPGVSVVLGYICHILMMCSIFLQVPLRHPMKHLGSRSVIYNQVYPDIPDKEREFPLYTKGKDRAHFSYAVFLLNKNISQLRWYLHHKYTKDLKETLKHLRSLLLGDDAPEYLHLFGCLPHKRPDVSAGNSTADSALTPDYAGDPLLDRIHEELRRGRGENEASACGPSPPGRSKSGLLKTAQKAKGFKTTHRALTISEAYLNRRISKDLFFRCAAEGFHSAEQAENASIKIKEGVEEFQATTETHSAHSDSIEEGTDPLDPSAGMDSFVTKSIDIVNRAPTYPHDDSAIAATSRGTSGAGQQELLEQWLAGDVGLVTSDENEECLRMSMSDSSSPLLERTDRLLSTSQSFKLIKHRPVE